MTAQDEREESLLVLGATGMVGRHLVAAAQTAGLAVVPVSGRSGCDITRDEELRRVVERHRPGVIVNSAAFTSVDRAEDESDAAYAVNARGAANVAACAREVGAYLIHLSTDYVFGDGAPGPRGEREKTSARGVYALSKAEGEQQVLETYPDAAIVRVGNIYGRGGRNFAARLLDHLREGASLRLDSVRRLSPTPALAVAQQLLALLPSAPRGIFHATCEGATTWYHFAQTMVARTGLASAHLEPVHPSALPYRAHRPEVVLSRRALQALGLDRMPHWRRGLDAYLEGEGFALASESSAPQDEANRGTGGQTTCSQD